MAGRVHADVGNAPHGTEEAGRLEGKVSQIHSYHEKDTTVANGNTHQYSGEVLYPRHSHQHGNENGNQQHGHKIHHYDEELHPHGCLCTNCTYTSEAYCAPIIDLVSARNRKVSLYFTNFVSYYFVLDLVVVANKFGIYVRGFDSSVQPREYETKVKIVQRYPEMRTVAKTFWVKEVQHEDRVIKVPRTEIVGWEKILRLESVPCLKEVTKYRTETHYE